MSTALKTPDPIKHTLVVDLAIDADFVRYLIQYRDIFGMNYCGYWARGIEHDPRKLPTLLPAGAHTPRHERFATCIHSERGMPCLISRNRQCRGLLIQQ